MVGVGAAVQEAAAATAWACCPSACALPQALVLEEKGKMRREVDGA